MIIWLVLALGAFLFWVFTGLIRLVGAPVWPVIIVLVAMTLLFLWLPRFIVRGFSYIWPQVMMSIPHTKRREVALTFDDVPWHMNSTFREIVKILDAWGAKATFFIIADYVENTIGAREALVEMVRNGHQLGNHGSTDSPALLQYLFAYPKWTAEVRKCGDLIRNIYRDAGVKMRTNPVYRPGRGLLCQGMLNNAMTKMDWNEGMAPVNVCYRTVLGSVYPWDPLFCHAGFLFWHLRHHIVAGDVVILHDRPATPALLNKLMPWLRDKGLKAVTVETLLIL